MEDKKEEKPAFVNFVYGHGPSLINLGRTREEDTLMYKQLVEFLEEQKNESNNN